MTVFDVSSFERLVEQMLDSSNEKEESSFDGTENRTDMRSLPNLKIVSSEDKM